MEEIIINRRNDRAMEVLESELAAGKKHLALFYGSAHLADFRKRLEAKGWRLTGEFWEDAWPFPASKAQPGTADKEENRNGNGKAKEKEKEPAGETAARTE